MSDNLQCFRCGASLDALSLPLSRQDECPGCGRHLHVCRMCEHYDARVPRQCLEDDAEEVMDKEKLNFCDWFVAVAGRYDASGAKAASRAEAQLAALFGDADTADDDDDPARQAADDLFR